MLIPVVYGSVWITSKHSSTVGLGTLPKSAGCASLVDVTSIVVAFDFNKRVVLFAHGELVIIR